jgi:sugar phosphate isomerase/epimerase
MQSSDCQVSHNEPTGYTELPRSETDYSTLELARMAELAMNETTTFRWSFEEDVLRYAAAGISAIGVWRQKLSDCGQARAIDLLQRNRLQVAHLFWAGGFTGSDGRSYRESVDDAAEALRTAAELNSRILVVYSGPRAGHTYNHARRLIHGALVELAPLAAELGVTLAIEPMHPGCAAEWTFLTSLDDTLRLLAAIAHPHVKMVLDTYHLGLESGLVERIAAIVPQVALVQLGDARCPPDGEQNRCPLGEGAVPLPQIIAALKAGGYDGFYDVELIGEELESSDYPSLLEHAKEAFGRLVVSG